MIVRATDAQSPLRPMTPPADPVTLGASNRRPADAGPTKEDTQMRKLTLTIITVCGVAAVAAASTATASTKPEHSKTEHFRLITDSTVARHPVYGVIATGAFIDGGVAAHDRNGGLTLHLSAGTITLERSTPHPHITTTQTATACMQTASSTFSYTIVRGTGGYKGITGSGRATDHDAAIEQVVHGSCASHFAAAQGIVTANGQVSLP
jgi:hypothetical protein